MLEAIPQGTVATQQESEPRTEPGGAREAVEQLLHSLDGLQTAERADDEFFRSKPKAQTGLRTHLGGPAERSQINPRADDRELSRAPDAARQVLLRAAPGQGDLTS